MTYPTMDGELTNYYYYSQGIEPIYCNSTEHELYRSMVGALLYLSINTRIDIAYTVCMLARYVSQPTIIQLEAARHVFKYLIGTQDYSLVFHNNNELMNESIIEAFVDSDHASDKDDRISVTGYVVKLYGNTCIWASKKQSDIAHSSTEAEYYAYTHVIQEITWCRNWLLEVLGINNTNVPIYSDSNSAKLLAKNETYHQRTKHIDIRYHYIRQEINKSNVILYYVPTYEEQADILTKAAKRTAFYYLTSKLMSTSRGHV
jgi:hypothetical protein